MDHVVLRWTFGKPIRKRMLWRHTHVQSRDNTDAQGHSAVTILLANGKRDLILDVSFWLHQFVHFSFFPQSYSGVCDKDGCDFNPYRMGVHNFFGKGSSFSIDTSKVFFSFLLFSCSLIFSPSQPFTVVTQFITSNNLDSGTLSQINRLYVQVLSPSLSFSPSDSFFSNLIGILSEWSSLHDSSRLCHRYSTLHIDIGQLLHGSEENIRRSWPIRHWWGNGVSFFFIFLFLSLISCFSFSFSIFLFILSISFLFLFFNNTKQQGNGTSFGSRNGSCDEFVGRLHCANVVVR